MRLCWRRTLRCSHRVVGVGVQHFQLGAGGRGSLLDHDAVGACSTTETSVNEIQNKRQAQRTSRAHIESVFEINPGEGCVLIVMHGRSRMDIGVWGGGGGLPDPDRAVGVELPFTTTVDYYSRIRSI